MRVKSYSGKVEILDQSEFDRGGDLYCNIEIRKGSEKVTLANALIPEKLKKFIQVGDEVSLSGVSCLMRGGKGGYSKFFVVVSVFDGSKVVADTDLISVRGFEGFLTNLFITISASSLVFLHLTEVRVSTILPGHGVEGSYISKFMGADIYYHLAVLSSLFIIPTVMRMVKIRSIPKKLMRVRQAFIREVT